MALASAALGVPRAIVPSHSRRGASRIARAPSVGPTQAVAKVSSKDGSSKEESRGLTGIVSAAAVAGTTFAGADVANAASEMGDVAVDGRWGLVFALFVPALAWVIYNIGGAAAAQFNEQLGKGTKRGRGKVAALAAAAGLSALAGQANAATEVGNVAFDSRWNFVLAIFVPVLGWVAYNIGGAALNQLNDQLGREPRSRGVKAKAKKGGKGKGKKGGR